MARTKKPKQKIDFIVIELWEQGYNENEIAKKLNRANSTIKKIRSQLGYEKELPITKNWLMRSGIGKKWDEACKRFNHETTEA